VSIRKWAFLKVFSRGEECIVTPTGEFLTQIEFNNWLFYDLKRNIPNL